MWEIVLYNLNTEMVVARTAYFEEHLDALLCLHTLKKSTVPEGCQYNLWMYSSKDPGKKFTTQELNFTL